MADRKTRRGVQNVAKRMVAHDWSEIGTGDEVVNFGACLRGLEIVNSMQKYVDDLWPNERRERFMM